MIGDQHADAAVPQARDDRLNVVDRDRVDAGKRLVEQQEFRLGHECAGDLEPAPLAAGELIGFLRAQMLDGQLVQQSLQPALPFRFIDVQGLENRQHIFFDAQLAEYGRLLRQIADSRAGALIHRQQRDVAAVEQNRPLVGPNQSGDHVERRRLPCSVRPEQPDDLSLREIERHVVHDAAAFVRLDQMLRAEPAAAADNFVLAADRLAARDGILGDREESLRCRGAVRRHSRPYVGGEDDRRIAPQRSHRQHQHLEHCQARQDGRREIGPRVVHGQAAGIRQRRAFRMRAQLEEFLTIRHGEVTERGASLLIRDAHQCGGRERERGIARREEIAETIDSGHGRGGAAPLTLSATTAGRGSRCTPSDLPETTT